MAVELINVSKSFGNVMAVHDVSLQVTQGELVTLLGPSGCGKTTTLRMIAGFESPSSGKIIVHGKDVTHVAPYLRDTPMVFQSYALLPHLTVRENAAFGLKVRKLSAQVIQERIQRVAHDLGLHTMLDRYPHALSGGQQQRVALLRALVTEPQVLLFDEPLSNLDAQMRTTVRDDIRRLQRSVGFAAIYVTHDQLEAMAISDRMVIMHGGRIAQVGTPHELYNRPCTRQVASFLGEASFVPITISREIAGELVVDGPLGSFTLPAPEKRENMCLMLRPHQIRLSSEGAKARVQSVTFQGADHLCVLDLQGIPLLLRTADAPRVGEVVSVQVQNAVLMSQN